MDNFPVHLSAPHKQFRVWDYFQERLICSEQQLAPEPAHLLPCSQTFRNKSWEGLWASPFTPELETIPLPKRVTTSHISGTVTIGAFGGRNKGLWACANCFFTVRSQGEKSHQYRQNGMSNLLLWPITQCSHRAVTNAACLPIWHVAIKI